MECFNTSFSLPSLPCSGCSVNFQIVNEGRRGAVEQHWLVVLGSMFVEGIFFSRFGQRTALRFAAQRALSQKK